MTPRRPVITLTTDFGSSDAYVAAIKGVILGINPEAIIVDISHDVGPQQVAEAAFILSTAWPYFPPGTIHVVVVDPGVGTARRALLLASESAFFIAPDNGVLSYIVEHVCSPAAGASTAAPRRLCPKLRAFVLTQPRYWRSPVSHTFHGRDIFAPVAAHLSLGVAPEEMGEAVDSVLAFAVPPPHREAGVVVGHIVHIDHFGNLITNITEADIAAGVDSVEVAGRSIAGVGQTYAQRRGLVALIGSSGHLEIAVRDGSAARLLKSKVGDTLKLRLSS